MITTLEEIGIFTNADNERLLDLVWEAEMKNWVSKEESNERTSLIFKRGANRYKVKATDDFEEEKSDKNYTEQAIKSFNAYLDLVV